jgi:hypothetical protein
VGATAKRHQHLDGLNESGETIALVVPVAANLDDAHALKGTYSGGDRQDG